MAERDQTITLRMEDEEMEIKVLGLGCKRCRKAEKIVREAVAESGVDGEVKSVANILGNLRHWLEDDPQVVALIEKLPMIQREALSRKRE